VDIFCIGFLYLCRQVLLVFFFVLCCKNKLEFGLRVRKKMSIALSVEEQALLAITNFQVVIGWKYSNTIFCCTGEKQGEQQWMEESLGVNEESRCDCTNHAVNHWFTAVILWSTNKSPQTPAGRCLMARFCVNAVESTDNKVTHTLFFTHPQKNLV